MLHIIHLSRRKDRWDQLQEQLSKQGNPQHKIWEGCDNPERPYEGIAQSHKQIVRYAADHNLEQITIAEDDIQFSAPGAYNFFISSIPKDFDLFLGGITTGDVDKNNTVKDFSGLTLYTVHNRFYDTFLATPETSNIDRLLKHRGKYVVCSPLVALQANGYSDNLKTQARYESFYSGKKYYPGPQ